jgi:ATP-dependent RNA helicase HelY
VSALVYESRVSDDAMAPKVPSGKAKAALGEMVRIWGRLDALEEEHGVSATEGVGQREPDVGFAWAAYRWADGAGLDAVLREEEMPAGDFVRWCKQIIDVLGQLSAAASEEGTVAKNARKAIDAMRRGVVAYSSVG